LDSFKTFREQTERRFKTLEDAGKVAKLEFGSGWIAPDAHYGIFWFKNKPVKHTGGGYSVGKKSNEAGKNVDYKYVGVLYASKYPDKDLIKI